MARCALNYFNARRANNHRSVYIYIYVTDVAMPVRAVCKTSLS